MTDPLLRLARVVSRMADHVHTDDIAGMARHLVLDLEAAPAPERRTITREEFSAVAQQLRNREVEYPDNLAHVFAAAWRLTVEDA